jgi:ABC-type multidrug transport system ATPase subunit
MIVFDEPAAGLDPRGRRELLELLGKLKQDRNLTIVYISSSLEDVIGLADMFYVLDQGRIVLSGTAREILTHGSELAALDIALPEATHIALTLQEVIPTLRTDVLRLAELEEIIGYPQGRPPEEDNLSEKNRQIRTYPTVGNPNGPLPTSPSTPALTTTTEEQADD